MHFYCCIDIMSENIRIDANNHFSFSSLIFMASWSLITPLFILIIYHLKEYNIHFLFLHQERTRLYRNDYLNNPLIFNLLFGVFDYLCYLCIIKRKKTAINTEPLFFYLLKAFVLQLCFLELASIQKTVFYRTHQSI